MSDKLSRTIESAFLGLVLGCVVVVAVSVTVSLAALAVRAVKLALQ